MIEIHETSISLGGNYRCCLDNFDDVVTKKPHKQIEKGFKIICPHCKATNKLNSNNVFVYQSNKIEESNK